MNHHEENMHVEFYDLCCYNKLEPYIWAIEHGGLRHIVTATKLKRKGVKAGMSDFLCIYPIEKYRGIWIEFKYGKNKQSEPQKKFEEIVTKAGYKYLLCYSAQEAFDKVIELTKINL